MNSNTQPTMVTPKMERPNAAIRLRTGLHAGPGGVTHTDNWREPARR